MTTTDRIRSILRVSHKSRNSDLELWIIFAQKSGMNLSQYQIDKLRLMPSFETIRRTRQKIQEQGDLRADPEVEERRYEKFKQVRGEIGSSQPESVEEQLNRLNLRIVEDR